MTPYLHRTLAYLFVAALAQGSAHAQTGLPAQAATMLRAAGLSEDAIGVSVIRLRDGAVLRSHRAEALMQPASTIKVLTAIVALDTLGPIYRGRAELRTSAMQEGSTLKGDVVLRGLGSADFDWVALKSMLDKLRDEGVREIAGDLVLDRGFFSPPRADEGVPPFDETPEFRYNVIPDALLLNMNLLRFDIETDAVGFRVRTTPTLDRVKVVSNMTWAQPARKCASWEDGWKIPTVVKSAEGEIRVYLEGEFPKNCKISTELNVIPRNDFVAQLFATLWREAGGTWQGGVREAALADAGRLIATHQSRTLAEVVRDINKRSDNTFTRLTHLTLGALEAKDQPGQALEATADRADRVVRAWLKKQAIDDLGLIIDNGSGLSRVARISASQLAQTLRAAAKSPWAPELLASLPIAGVDGGMGTRLKDSPAARMARIKTGGLRNVASVAGYVPDAKGEMHALVAMINDDTAKGPVTRPILDAIIDSVARSGTP